MVISVPSVGSSTFRIKTKSSHTYVDCGWDYKTADIKEFTHGIHPYPAMMIPQVARRLVKTYGQSTSLLFDPYCGSGTTLLEGMIAGRIRTIGTDLNPLARLIAQVKTTPVQIKALENQIVHFQESQPLTNAPIPSIPNIDYWFSKDVQSSLAWIKQYIDGISNVKIADVFRVAFSLTVRKTSLARNSQFKLHRIPQDRISHHNPDSITLMADALLMILGRMKVLVEAISVSHQLPEIHNFDTVKSIPSTILSPQSVDLIVTSPPYGDSRTTVAYGQFSRLSSQWLGYPNANQIDNQLMGGKKLKDLIHFDFRKIDQVIDKIAMVNECRACEVATFFADYRDSIRNISSVVKKGGHICYVVGNRTVKGYQIPLAETTIEFFNRYGFSEIDVFSRNIPNKRMPTINSPSNIPGEVGKTMTQEKIIICQKIQ
ncbi:MAG: DNA methyltransferase [Bacteroidetes bacterium]|nr:DNA methyltransferase [Bacteroidota bacterium]